MWRKLLVSKISRNVVQNRPSETLQVALITLSMDSINRNRWKKKHKMTIMAEKMEKQRKPGFLHDPISRSRSEGFCLAAKWPCVLNPSSTSVTKAVTTDSASRTLFDQTLAHSILHMSAHWHLILIGHYWGKSASSTRHKCLNSVCETWPCPEGSFSLGGELKTDKHKQQGFQFWPLWRAHQTGSPVFLPPVGPNPIPDRSRDELTPLQKNSHSSLSANWESRNGVCVHT